jgi:hypothetical protein
VKQNSAYVQNKYQVEVPVDPAQRGLLYNQDDYVSPDQNYSSILSRSSSKTTDDLSINDIKNSSSGTDFDDANVNVSGVDYLRVTAKNGSAKVYKFPAGTSFNTLDSISVDTILSSGVSTADFVAGDVYAEVGANTVPPGKHHIIIREVKAVATGTTSTAIQNTVSSWVANVTYNLEQLVLHTDGKFYKSLISNNSSSTFVPSNWQLCNTIRRKTLADAIAVPAGGTLDTKTGFR